MNAPLRSTITATNLEQDPRWRLTLEVVNSPAFERSLRLRAFLLFICEMELSGRRAEINEQQIGVHVFGRAPGYNPGDDSIVRSQARLLRQRLEEYFRNAGRNAPLRIEIPKGSYVPSFEPNLAPQPVEPHPLPLPEPVREAPPSQASATPLPAGRPRAALLWLTVAVLSFLLGAVALFSVQKLRRPAPAPNLESRFWARLFAPTRLTMVVPADSTLILIQELTSRPVTLTQYLNHDDLRSLNLPSSGPLHPVDLENSQYTSMADLNLVAGLVAVPQAARGQVQVRYARDLSMSDAKKGNLILIGGGRANPWVELFAPAMNFVPDFDWTTRQNVVLNKAPRPGESKTYAEIAGTQSSAYGFVAFEPSLDHQGDTLLVSGTTSAGTQLAADFLLNAQTLDQFLHSIARPDGSIPHFELLLVGRNLGGRVFGWSIVASRTRP